MIHKERLLKVLITQHASEKTSTVMKKTNIAVFKVVKNATKTEIKTAMQKIFQIKVKKINTLIVKGKIKRQKNCVGRRNDWKKAYITLKEGQNLEFLRDVKE